MIAVVTTVGWLLQAGTKLPEQERDTSPAVNQVLERHRAKHAN